MRLNACLIQSFYSAPGERTVAISIRVAMEELESTREKIIQAAGPVFADSGFEGATVRDICNSAGVNLASVNYHFRDKLGLYIETVQRAHEMRSQAIAVPQWSADTPPETKLYDLIHTLLKRALSGDDQAWQKRLMMREILHPTEACRPLVEKGFRPTFEVMLAVLDDLFPEEVSPADRRRCGFSIIGQILHYRLAGEVVTMLTPVREYSESYSVDALSEHITRFSLAAVTSFVATPKFDSPQPSIE